MEDRSSPSYISQLHPRSSQRLASRPLEPHLNLVTLTPRSATTASQLLASFSPRLQTKKSLPSDVATPQNFPIAMEPKRSSRRKERISYVISDDSESSENSSFLDSTFSTPQKTPRKKMSIIDLEDELGESEPSKTPPPRLSSAGHSLRQPKELNLSLRAQENGDKRVVKRRRKTKSRSKPKTRIQVSAPKTARAEVREHVNTETAGKRANFFLAKKDLFLPLLPEANHIQRLTAQRQRTGEREQDLSVPYEIIEHQPSG